MNEKWFMRGVEREIIREKGADKLDYNCACAKSSTVPREAANLLG